jgi:putative ABC transport system permease protein
VATLIIVASANVATLMLARRSSRRRETAMRLALGAGSFAVVRLAAVEGLVLALAGTGAGLAVAWASLRALASVGSVLPRFNEAGLSLEAVGFALALSIGSALTCSAVSFGELKRANLSDVLSESGRAGTPGARGHRLRRGLVALQIAMACALLITGSLLLRSFANILREHPGFEATGAVYFDLYLPNSRYPDAAAHTRFYRELIRRLEDMPSVEAAGGLLYFPYKPKLWPVSIQVDGAPLPEGQEPVVYYNQVAGDYFGAMSIPLEAGRLPDERETWEGGSRPVVVVNRTMATLLFGDASAIGRRVRTGRTEAWNEIIGVVGDVRQRRLDLPPLPEYYTTFKEMPMPFQSLVVRGRPDRSVTVAEARAVVRQIDPGVALANVMPLAQWIRLHTRERQFALRVLSAIAVLAVLIAVVGVYGAVSYAVAQRRREMGIRLALGANPGDVRALVFGEGLRLVLAGTGAGVLAAVLAAPVPRGMLYGLGPLDPVAYVAVASLLALAALAACWWPARSASRLPLAQTLRAD